MKKIFVMIIVFLFLIVIHTAFSGIEPSGYIIEGNKVYWEKDNWGKVVQWPHHLNSGGSSYVSVTSYFPQQEQLDVVFRFEKDVWAKKLEYYKSNVPHYTPIYGLVNESYVCNHNTNYTQNPNYFWCWATITCHYDSDGVIIPPMYNCNPFSEPNSQHDMNYTFFEHSFLAGNVANKTAWWEEMGVVGNDVDYYDDWSFVPSDKYEARNVNGKKYVLFKNITFNPGQTKNITAKLIYDGPEKEPIKYDIFIKKTEDSIDDAISNEHYVMVDPWLQSQSWSAIYSFNKTKDGCILCDACEDVDYDLWTDMTNFASTNGKCNLTGNGAKFLANTNHSINLLFGVIVQVSDWKIEASSGNADTWFTLDNITGPGYYTTGSHYWKRFGSIINGGDGDSAYWVTTAWNWGAEPNYSEYNINVTQVGGTINYAGTKQNYAYDYSSNTAALRLKTTPYTAADGMQGHFDNLRAYPYPEKCLVNFTVNESSSPKADLTISFYNTSTETLIDSDTTDANGLARINLSEGSGIKYEGYPFNITVTIFDGSTELLNETVVGHDVTGIYPCDVFHYDYVGASDSCTPTGSEDWVITDNCTKSYDGIDIGDYDINLSTGGSLSLLDTNLTFGKLNIVNTTPRMLLNITFTSNVFFINMSGN